VPVAERAGRIMDITKYGLEFLFADMARSKLADPSLSRVFAVNISKECLTKATFITLVRKLIGDYSINPQRLVFEIDAAAIDLHDKKLTESLRALRDLGIQLAIDNYGVDNASLLKLQDIEFDIIKIDRSFIDRICDNRKTYEIVKNIIKMAKDLKIDIVAKGVDTKEQKELLQEMKCFYMQGRLFGEPDYLTI
jgi:EAL domain-containing protein (putative c-di-GMP-specific phosphodiesterase class I)